MVIIAIIGIDGSGKSTQAKMLSDRLESEGYDCLCVQPVVFFADRINSLTKKSIMGLSPRMRQTSSRKESTKNNAIKCFKKLFLAAFGYFYVLSTILYLKYLLGKDKVIVCDRFFFQFLFDLFGTFSLNLLKILPKPDLIFRLNGDLDYLYSRMSNDFDTTISKDYYYRVLAMFQQLSKTYQIIEFESNRSREEIRDKILLHSTNYLQSLENR